MNSGSDLNVCDRFCPSHRTPLLTSMSTSGDVLETPRTTLSMILYDWESEMYFVPNSVDIDVAGNYFCTGKMTLTTNVLINGPLDERQHPGECIHRFIIALQTMQRRMSSLVSPGALRVSFDCLARSSSGLSGTNERKGIRHLHPSTPPPTTPSLLALCFVSPGDPRDSADRGTMRKNIVELLRVDSWTVLLHHRDLRMI